MARSGEIKMAYNAWADTEGLKPRERLNATSLGRRLRERFEKERDGQGRFYIGVRVKS